MTASVAPVESPAPKAESCYKRYQREIAQCTGNVTAGCRAKASDSWDICEATGFWPN